MPIAMEMKIFFLYNAHIDYRVQYYNMLENSLCLALDLYTINIAVMSA
jgi:hypothetical protein